MNMKRMITILGPTASGKTPLAALLAARIGGEIISADSRQVYRRMDIGTGKDLADYTIVAGGLPVNIPYHLIDICEPGTKYNLLEGECIRIDALNKGQRTSKHSDPRTFNKYLNGISSHL